MIIGTPLDANVIPTGDRFRVAHGLGLRLGSRKSVSNNDILRWVRKYGLLERRDERKPYFVIDPDEEEPYGPRDPSFLGPPDGLSRRRCLVPNQASISVRDFRAEVANVHTASVLYARMRGGGIDGIEWLKGRVHDLYERQESAPGMLSEIDRGLLDSWGERIIESGVRYCRDDDGLWNDATRTLWVYVRKKVSKVGLDFAGDNFAVGGVPPWPLTYSQSFSCPDLISAIYLQFYFFVTGALPVKICANENCRVPFEMTRKDKVYCSNGCRSSGRPSRRGRNL